MDDLLNLPPGPGLRPLVSFVRSFDRPGRVADEVRALLNAEDPLVAPRTEFTQDPGERLFENWSYPVIARTLYEVEVGRLLCLPPGSKRFSTYRSLMPTIMRRHLEVNFPRLKSELANRPNLFFQGVFYPNEIEIANMEMISLHHGRNYVVRCDLDLEGVKDQKTVALKPTHMGVEAIITSILDELNRRMPTNMRNTLGPLRAPAIVSVDSSYGILEYLPGKNGVEVLPRGINTGTIQSLRSNEFPDSFDIDAEGLLELTDEFAKQAALAFYLRLYDRKPDQMMFDPAGEGRYRVSHIDFGRALKINYALPWKRYYATEKAPLVFEDHEIPYFEAASSLIFLPHFIPRSLKDQFSPFEGRMRRRLQQCFTSLADFFQRNVEVIREHLMYLIGEPTQFDDHEVDNIRITEKDVQEVNECLLSFDPSPDEIFQSVLHLAQRERNGTTPTRSPGSGDDSIYLRSVRSGSANRKLQPNTDQDPAYDLRDYSRGGQVFYHSDRQYLFIHFGRRPQVIIDYVHWYFSPRLAEFIEQFEELVPGTSVKIHIDGHSEIHVPPNLVRRDVEFPTAALQEVRQVVQGFAPQNHVENFVNSFRSWAEDHPEASFSERETRKQSIVFENGLEGKEVLQCYRGIRDSEHPVRTALSEVIYHMLSNPDYLADKDPVKSVNNLVVNLGHKHGFVEPLGEQDLPEDESLVDFYRDAFDVYNHDITAGEFPDQPPQHLAHVRSMILLGEAFSREVDLTEREQKGLLCGIVLHDLAVVEDEFGELLMNPNGRLDRPIMDNFLRQHPRMSVTVLERYRERGRLDPPDPLTDRSLRRLLLNHHAYRTRPLRNRLGDTRVHQILHLVDHVASFSDLSRPDYWKQGHIPLVELAPRWVQSEFNRDHVGETVYEGAQEVLSDKHSSVHERIDSLTTPFLELFNALQMAGALDHGLDPQNPHLLHELKERHGGTVVEQIWSRVLESDLPVDDKIRVFRRMDELAPLFTRLEEVHFTFVNANPRPIHRVVETILNALEKKHLIILTGFFPRVTKAYRRFKDEYGSRHEDRLDRIVAICGLRRLHFIRHSYPYEADFEVPFHRIIQNYRMRTECRDDLCFIPFEEFYSGYQPVENAATRIRKLEKASELEEQTLPDRVREEARRYEVWVRQNEVTNIDERENERLRRILLNNFTNREVLYFYTQTLPEQGSVIVALKEVIGALRENPSYLSARSSRYDLHELVRSLSQIHFYQGDQSASLNRVDGTLEELNLNLRDPIADLLGEYGSELNFFKGTLTRGIRILDRLCGKEERPNESMVFALLASGLFAEDTNLHDYLLSPEDISYNNSLRRRLMSYPADAAEHLFQKSAFQSLSPSLKKSVQDLLQQSEPPLEYGLVQAALYISMYIDFSRIENWERGRRTLLKHDVDHLASPLRSTLTEFVPDRVADRVLDRVESLKEPSSLEYLNRLSGQTHSFIYLFNALSLTADLRYGLFPRGLNTFENARQLYGADRVNKLINAIIESDLSMVESIKICRKIRYLAAALQRHETNPEGLFFLNLDRSGTWRIPGDRPGEDRMYILSGELSNTLAFWDEIAPDNPDLQSRCYVLVGEEYPLLIKETTLARTDFLRGRITDYRKRHQPEGRHLLIPARNLLDEAPRPGEPGAGATLHRRSTLFFKAWTRLFDR